MWMPKTKLQLNTAAMVQDVAQPQQQHKQQQHVLPSFHAFCKTIEQSPPPTPTPTSATATPFSSSNSNNKNHIRTTSMPARLPSQTEQKQRLSLEVLLDAIELDQSMYEAYQFEWSKTSAMRAAHLQRSANRRKRSKSAPGVPRWRTPCSTPKSRNASVQQIAESIVQKHIECARKK
ncbi:hypothetical protein BDB00DRAFT_785982 [Zychaea mexicana]|uniref:uncharacterized protein n=1 Tax=Zychaea mexicana TaxID=64656 RepID=UPI0022FDE989|nr:uncharacterized protein BDB00DRAFT_785982 [Zychaea mexicana]KAI9496048.1 hypothetical protein BDB00DRAFT_785982 [Zychaea mexicana]